MCAPPRAQTRSLTFDRDAVGLLDACALAAFGALAQSLVARWIPCPRNFRAACIKRLAAGEAARLAEPGLRGLRTRGCTRRGVSTRVGRRQRPHAVASERARVWQRGGIPVCTVGVVGSARLVLVALVLLLELLAPDMNSAKLSVICFVRSPSSFFFDSSVAVTAEVSAAAAIDPAPAAATRSSKAIAGCCRCVVVPRIVPSGAR
jgi:hypothetical protein